jgi:hypothetical protein
VIYMSGYADDKLGAIAGNGELTLIQKPFYLDDLLRKVQEILLQKELPSIRHSSARPILPQS